MQVRTAIDPNTASGPTKELFEQVQRSLKRIPNMLRLMANSPAVLEAYLANSPAVLEAYLRFNDAFSRTRLTPRLRGLITVAVAEINGCDYTLSTAMSLGRR